MRLGDVGLRLFRGGSGPGIAGYALVLALFSPAAWTASCVSNGTAPQNWSNPLTWTCGIVPTAADDVTIANGHVVTVNAPARSAGALTIAGGATATSLTLATNLTVTNVAGGALNTGNVIMNAPTAAVIKQIVVGASPNLLTVTGNVTINGGTTVANAGNINRLTATSGRVNIGGNLIINGGAVQSNANVTLTTGRIDVTGNVTLTGGGAANRDALLSVTGAPAVAGNGINITGNLTTIATFTASSNVTLGVGSLITVTGNVTNGDTLTVGGGTFTANGATFATTAVGNNANTTVAAGTLIIAGNATVNASTTVNSTSTMTVSTGRISVTGNLTVTGGNNAALRNALVSVTGAPAVAGNGVNVNGTLSTVLGTGTVASASVSITAANGVVNANGDFTNNGTFTNNAVAGQLFIGGATATVNGSFIRGTGRITMDGAPPLAVTQTLSGTALTLAPAANGFNNVTIDNTTGFGVTLSSTVAVKGALALTNGVVATGANTLNVTTGLCAAPSVTRTNGWVNGNLQKRIPAGASVCTFEVGGATDYTPLTATFAAATAGNITAKSTDLDHASIGTSGLDPSLTANRFWSLTSTVAQAAFNAVFNFVAGDLDTDTQPTTVLWVGRNFSSGAWATPVTGTRNALNTQLTGLTLVLATQKDFVLGEAAQGAGTGSFSAVENVLLVASPTGNAFTKLAGTAFNLDLAALNAARTALDATFKGKVKVELLDSSSGGVLDANGCNAGWPTIQTLGTDPQFLVADAGRKQNVAFTEANAWPNVRVRATSPATGTATLIGCSIDNFSIRPPSITSVVGGAPLDMNNTGTSGTPRAIAGSGTFTLIAATGLAGYAGTSATPKIDNTAVEAHAGAIANGSVVGSFPAAVAGTSTGTSSFTYSEVGNFRFLGSAATLGSTAARGAYDDTFTAVDGASDCTADFSNVLASGKYGCKFGITADTGFFGRFYPANFVLTPGTINRRIAACAPVSAFIYAGEEFRATFTLTAKNGAGVPATTQNYDPGAGFATFNPATIANLNLGAVDLADATPPLTRTALTGSLTLGTSSGTWASGAVTVTADMMLARAASPDGPFESFSLGIDPFDPVLDPDVKLSVYNLDTSVPADTDDRGQAGTSKIRFGRLRILNAVGVSTLALTVPIQTQYWNGTSFVLNSSDSCTTLDRANFALGPYDKNLNACETIVSTDPVTFASGTGTLNLSAPGAGNEGSVNLTPQLSGAPTPPTDKYCNTVGGLETPASAAGKSYLQGAWTGSTYDKNPSARARFGLYGAQPRNFIFFRENY